jgi:hypothetical protein
MPSSIALFRVHSTPIPFNSWHFSWRFGQNMALFENRQQEGRGRQRQQNLQKFFDELC